MNMYAKGLFGKVADKDVSASVAPPKNVEISDQEIDAAIREANEEILEVPKRLIEQIRKTLGIT